MKGMLQVVFVGILNVKTGNPFEPKVREKAYDSPLSHFNSLIRSPSSGAFDRT